MSSLFQIAITVNLSVSCICIAYLATIQVQIDIKSGLTLIFHPSFGNSPMFSKEECSMTLYDIKDDIRPGGQKLLYIN